MKAIVGGKVLTESGLCEDCVVFYEEKIARIAPAKELVCTPCESVIDAKGCIVSPGFINQHVHGCAGFDVMDATAEALAAIRTAQAQMGVTAFLATTMTQSFSRIGAALEQVRAAQKLPGGAKLLGAHLEGPFIQAARRGAHDARYIEAASFERIAPYADVIRMATVAPECASAAFAAACRSAGITLSIGHSDADYETAQTALRQGFSQFTHVFNALPPLHHRAPGAVGAALDSDAYCELIADNIHVHPALQRLLLRAKGAARIVLVTDSMRACLLADGVYELGGQKVVVEEKCARLESGVIAGSVLAMPDALRNFQVATRLPTAELLRTVTENPARSIGCFAQIGSIASGKAADFTICDASFGVRMTIVDGRIAYSSQDLSIFQKKC